MPGSTPIYGLPYPLPADPIADGATTIRQLAETVEDTFAAGGGGGGGGAVLSVNGQTGLVNLDAGNVGAAPTVHTHPWADVTGKPSTYPPAAHTHPWADVTGKPTTYPPAAHTHPWADVTGKPTTYPPTTGTTADTAKPGNYQPTWAQVTGKPTTFAPTPSAITPAATGAVANGGGVAQIVAVTTMPTTTAANTVYIVRP